MKYSISFIIVLLSTALIACGQNTKDRIILGEKHAEDQIKKALADKTTKPFYDTLIKTKELAISIVEPILFDIYGKSKILKERPYECYLINGFWYISGTIPKGWHGGGFEIIISSKNGEVIRLIHYK